MTIQLDQSVIYAGLNSSVRGYLINDNPVEVFQELDSTQRYLKDKLNSISLSKKGCAALVAAESQSSGRGRMNRDWHASSGDNILLSCCWVYESIPKDLAALSLALMVSLAERLRCSFDLPVTIKWPNDLLVEGKKIAGMLIDVETGGQCRIVVGLGLNVAQSLGADVIEQSWTDLSQYNVVVDRNSVIAGIFSDWVDIFARYSGRGFSDFQGRWNELSEHKGRRVVLSKLGQKSADDIEGIMEGVDHNGFLLIRSATGVHEISDSSYSLRVVS